MKKNFKCYHVNLLVLYKISDVYNIHFKSDIIIF